MQIVFNGVFTTWEQIWMFPILLKSISLFIFILLASADFIEFEFKVALLSQSKNYTQFNKLRVQKMRMI